MVLVNAAGDFWASFPGKAQIRALRGESGNRVTGDFWSLLFRDLLTAPLWICAGWNNVYKSGGKRNIYAIGKANKAACWSFVFYFSHCIISKIWLHSNPVSQKIVLPSHLHLWENILFGKTFLTISWKRGERALTTPKIKLDIIKKIKIF